MLLRSLVNFFLSILPQFSQMYKRVFSCNICAVMTAWLTPFVRIYIYTYEIPKPLRLLYVYIYTYTDFAIEIWGFYRRLTDTLRYHHTRCSRASGLLASISRHVYQVGRKVESTRSCLLFLASFSKITIVRPSSIHRLAWNTTADYMDFLP